MKGSKLKQLMTVAWQSALLVGITLSAVIPFSCRITAQGVQLLGGDYAPPVLTDFTVVDEKTLRLEFTEKVKISGYVVAEVLDDEFDSMEHSSTLDLSPAIQRASGIYGSIPCSLEYEDNDTVVKVIFENEMLVGQGYEFYSEVNDEIGNSLTMVLPFAGFNSRVPQLLMTEIQSESISSQKSSEKKDGTYRNEFVEVLVLKGGNLAGLELCSGYDGESKSYDFPVVEVETGEVFVVHLRNRGNGCISEESDDMAAAFSSYTSPLVRDLWTKSEATALGNKTDILILRNKANGEVLDAVMYRASNIEAWTKTMLSFSQLLDDGTIYDSGDIENAFITDSLTSTKTLVRKNAKKYQTMALENTPIEYPVYSDADSWEVSAEPSPGEV